MDFLTGCASISYTRPRLQVIALVQEVVVQKGLPVSVTRGWWESFRRRHPKLTLRVAAPVRAIASDTEIRNRGIL